MRFLKLFIFFLLAVLAVTALLSMLMPVKQKIERSTTIHAPAAVIYQQLIKLENFNKWSVWSQQDSTEKNTLTGPDGTVGAALSWTGDPNISGDGKIEIGALEENKKIVHDLHFIKPKKAEAHSTFTLNETNGMTTVTWNFELATPRPWNIFNLFYSLDKKKGKDFEDGLAALKMTIEKTTGGPVTKKYEVSTMNFPATTYAMIRQQIKWADISSFFAQHLPIIYNETEKIGVRPGNIPNGLIYTWDEKNQQTDMAAALPVSPGTKIDNPIIQVVDLPASKAVYVDFYGSYDNESAAYTSIRKYLADNSLKEKSPVIEQYIAGPGQEKDSSKWVTKIVFLIE